MSSATQETQIVSVQPSGLAQSALFLTAMLLAITLLSLVLAYWTWVWLAPTPLPRTPMVAPTMSAPQAARGLFGQPQRNAAAPVVNTSIKLLGVVAAKPGRTAYAVVQMEPRQILAVRAGSDIASGVRVAEVHADKVILERGGVRETLQWPQRSAAADAPATAPR